MCYGYGVGIILLSAVIRFSSIKGFVDCIYVYLQMKMSVQGTMSSNIHNPV